MNRRCLSVEGPSGAGKTVFATALVARLAPAVLVRRDWFIRGRTTGNRRFDHEAAGAMARAVSAWRSGQRVEPIGFRRQDVIAEELLDFPGEGTLVIDDCRDFSPGRLDLRVILLGDPARFCRQERDRNGDRWSMVTWCVRWLRKVWMQVELVWSLRRRPGVILWHGATGPRRRWSSPGRNT